MICYMIFFFKPFNVADYTDFQMLKQPCDVESIPFGYGVFFLHIFFIQSVSILLSFFFFFCIYVHGIY